MPTELRLVSRSQMDFNSVLNELNFKRVNAADILTELSVLMEKFKQTDLAGIEPDKTNWVMGQIRNRALGNMSLTELSKSIAG